jgi:AcrR family transcriptional regulator
MGQAVAAQAGVRAQGRGERTKAALCDAALALFAAKGVERTSVDEITASAAVAKGTFYVHFQRKQDVLLERGAQLVVELASAPSDAATAAPSALRSLAAGLAALNEAGPRPVMGRMVREIVGNREDWLRVLADRPTLAAVIQPVIEAGQSAGRIRADQSPQRLAQALTILWLDNIIGWAERPEARPLSADLARATELFCDGALVDTPVVA